MMAWGDRMLKFTGKQRADMYSDLAQADLSLGPSAHVEL